MKKLKGHILKYIYRITCLYDYYIRPDCRKLEYKKRTKQYGNDFYTGFWDKVTRTTRSPYCYKFFVFFYKKLK